MQSEGYMDEADAMSNGEPTTHKRGLKFSRDINAGHILTATMISFGMIAGYSAFYSRLNLMEYKQIETEKVIVELRASNIRMDQAIVELKSNNTKLTIIQEPVSYTHLTLP